VADAMTAHAMAARLGNDAAMGSAASNLAICYGRLGNYQAQIGWGEKGLHQIGSKFTGFRDIQLCFARAFGNAMLGQTDEALAALSEANARIPHTAPRWMLQAWHFQQADVLHLAGKKRDALEKAKIALADDELHSDSLAGPFARWITLCAVASGQLAPARNRLKRLRANLDIYDAVDQVEILAAGCLLERALGQSANAARLRAEQEKVRGRLVDLPSATTAQLVRLSIIERAR
jgi:tetratricopeptide (TPR) repeat protein